MTDLLALCFAAGAIAVAHTALGPDHYLPFVALSKAQGWTLRRTLWVTLSCGLGHVASSIMLALLVSVAGWSLARFELFQGLRGDVAAWLLVGLGLAYALWGLKHLARNAAHSHAHSHLDGTTHAHTHDHHREHVHPHPQRSGRTAWVVWGLFVIFLLGPCEPLVPLLLVPASQQHWGDTATIAVVFVATTLCTMLLIVAVLSRGYERLAARWRNLQPQRFFHVAAGSTMAACGGAMLLGL